MSGVSQVEQALKYILEERTHVLVRQTGCIQRQRLCMRYPLRPSMGSRHFSLILA